MKEERYATVAEEQSRCRRQTQSTIDQGDKNEHTANKCGIIQDSARTDTTQHTTQTLQAIQEAE